MEVKILTSTTIAYGGGDDDDNTTAASSIPLTVFDTTTLNVHISVVFAFSAPTPPNADIVGGLSATLSRFPILAGKFGEDALGRPCVLIGKGGAGALVVEAEVGSVLKDHIPFAPTRELLRLHPPPLDPPPKHLLQVQLNRFKCGGLVVGVTAHHRVADGQSMSAFFLEWGRSVRGIPVDFLPCYDRSWARARDPPRCEFEHWGVEFRRPDETDKNQQQQSGDADLSPDPRLQPSSGNAGEHHLGAITNINLYFSFDFVAGLKEKMLPARCTTFEAVTAHLWRKITIARRLDPEETTTVRFSVNGRSRLRPPVPPEYFGNLVAMAFVRAKARELIEKGTAEAARVVRDGVLGMGDAYFRSVIDFEAMHGDQELVPMAENGGLVLHPDLEVDSWLGFRFADMDFGEGGRLCEFSLTWVPMEGVVVIIPDVEGKGVKVRVTLFEQYVSLLKEIAHCVD